MIVRRAMRLAFALLLTVLKRRLAYRGDLLVQSLDELLRGAVAWTMLMVYTSRSTAVGGWGADELLFVLGFSLVPIALFHCFCSNLYQLSNTYIIQGNLDRVLLRPYPAFAQICFDRLAVEDLSGVVLGGALMAVAAARIPGFAWDPLHLLLLAVLLASSFAIVVAVFMAFAASGFWFEDRVGMTPPVYNLMEFGRWPADLYHPALKIFITCAIPFSFIAFYPASLLVRGPGPGFHPAWLTPGVAAVALLVSNWMWSKGLSRYESAGS